MEQTAVINAQNERVLSILAKLIEMNNNEINEQLQGILVEGNWEIKLNSHHDDSKLVELLNLIGDAEVFIAAYEDKLGGTSFTGNVNLEDKEANLKEENKNGKLLYKYNLFRSG